jgi:hypothetical protein
MTDARFDRWLARAAASEAPSAPAGEAAFSEAAG